MDEEPVRREVVEVYRAYGEVDFQSVRSMLEGSGIEVIADQNTLASLYGLTVGEVSARSLYVDREDAIRAISLLEAAMDGEFQLKEPDKPNSSGSILWESG